MQKLLKAMRLANCSGAAGKVLRGLIMHLQKQNFLKLRLLSIDINYDTEITYIVDNRDTTVI